MQFRLNVIPLAVMALAAQGVLAQQADASKKDEPVKLEKVEVTGTSIKRTDTETASPVQVIKAADIKAAGVTSMAELLRLIPAVTKGGQDDLTTGNGFATGTASASLRGLGSASTLTLINGRRMAATATADPNAGQSTLYNLNNIPMAAIERVEVVKDGASAVYGSDAIAGVVNFILKKDYKGFEASMRGSGSLNGDFSRQGASFFGGFGDFDADRYNAMIGVDFSLREDTPSSRTRGYRYDIYKGFSGPLEAPDTSIASSPNFWPQTKPGATTFVTTAPVTPKGCSSPSVLSTTYLASGAPACVMDLSPYAYHVYPSRGANVFGKISFNLGANLTGTLEAGFSRLENEYPSGSGYATLSSSRATWFDPSGKPRSFRYVVPVNHPDNPLFQANSANQLQTLISARLMDIPAGEKLTQDTSRLVADLTGEHFGWDWQAGVLLNQSKRRSVETGLVNSVTAQQGLDRYRFGGVNGKDILDLISPTAVSVGDTSVTMANLKGSREFGQLAGGPIGVAAGLETRRESIDMRPDARLDAGDFVSRGASKATGSRQVHSAFAELNLPVLKSLNIEAALRSDQYSDYGNSTTPKLGFKWKPFDSLSIRGTAADGFRAPGLTQISKSSVSSFQSIPTWRDTARCPTINGLPSRIPGATGYDSANECNRTSSAASRSIASFIVANTALQPETSRSYTLGLVYAPNDSFNGTFDLYQITRENEIDRFSSASVIERYFQNGELGYANDILRSPDPTTALKDAQGNPIPGTEPIVGVKRKYLNLGFSKVRGADLELSYRWKFDDGMVLSNSLYVGYVKDFLFQREKGGAVVNLADSAGDQNPRFKGRLSSSLRVNRDFTVFGGVNYVSGMAAAQINSTAGTRVDCHPVVMSDPMEIEALGWNCRSNAFTTVDLGARYSPIKNLTFSATIRNVGNTRAPYTFYAYYDTTLHNIMGRAYSASIDYKWD